MKGYDNILRLTATLKKRLVEELLQCAIACEECASACLNDYTIASNECIKYTRDCADSCFHTARLAVRDSHLTRETIQSCERLCRICSKECEKYPTDHHQECFEACERCANTCLEFINSHQAV